MIAAARSCRILIHAGHTRFRHARPHTGHLRLGVHSEERRGWPGAPAETRFALLPGHDELCVPTRDNGMTAYLISLALVGLIAIAVWEGFS
jgi:hypothetical protein